MNTNERIGLWIVGAWGGVGTTVAVGLAALQAGLADETGLTSALPEFSDLDLLEWSTLTIGGHEIRETTYRAAAAELHRNSNVFTVELLERVGDRLEQFDRNVRVGTVLNVGPTIESLAADSARATARETAWATVERIGRDLAEFRQNNGLDRVLLVNLASTEPPVPDDRLQALRSLNWDDLERRIRDEQPCPVPASTLYAAAAMLAGCAYINFTPSLGSDLPALDELARRQRVVHCGRDGKTGETLLKSVLAPMFAARNLKVLSWVGHNIFGNLDGRVLDDPVNKATKVRSKDHLLQEILGYSPQTLVTIEYIESLGDWKTAWDHIHFQGFLGTKMAMQFTWQGCDSLLAAPLVLDLVRFSEREWRRGGCGVQAHLAALFKSPMGTTEARFAQQFEMLRAWAADVRRNPQRSDAS
ncbi:MAG: myo-inositol-1-phosphate synthase [Planctomycetota bacterium]|nr:MAG: myo-inositol-1-phosphate synthase [Planctomycetota bacterium]